MYDIAKEQRGRVKTAIRKLSWGENYRDYTPAFKEVIRQARVSLEKSYLDLSHVLEAMETTRILVTRPRKTAPNNEEQKKNQ